ncbi:outer membrane protein transport protein [Acinetobacter sp. C26M]|uniref:Transporter n=1 Tax=Acinetobacter proteolyticus TaxID=1776741 RepID=A0A2N0WB01_9GAMM|nr:MULTISPECIES: outer membrane protein transport protein [Acinetobacter]PKF31667.1 transporter [Acinetobacter proteolyticus]USA47445.1 outer membrane protein transport protein [Acinetobacter sp. C26M]USA50926.1 outer membrane protein transport protein [Acinetobacter sp. C26G]
MKFKYLFVWVLFVSPITEINAAMDQSGQSIMPFLESGNYTEFGIVVVDPSVSGKVRNRQDLVNDPSNLNLGEVANSFQFYNFALKLKLNENINLGLLFDQPFGANVSYPLRSNNSFSDNQFSQKGTSVKVDTKNLSLILGLSPFKNFQIFGGPVYQEVKGDISLRGNAHTEAFNGYNASFKRDAEIGWLTGLSYEIPEIALKAAITYRSKIKYEMVVTEDNFNVPLDYVKNEKTKLETPQSINLDFQTAITENALIYSNLRWVNWRNFETRPTQFGALSEILTTQATAGDYKNGFSLDSYKKDQYSATFGLGYQIGDRWGIFSDVGVDLGTGNPTSSLGPINNSRSIGIGFKYNPKANYFIAGGFKYFWFGDTTTQDGTYYLPIDGIKNVAEQADFKNNNAMAYALKIGYQF